MREFIKIVEAAMEPASSAPYPSFADRKMAADPRPAYEVAQEFGVPISRVHRARAIGNPDYNPRVPYTPPAHLAAPAPRPAAEAKPSVGGDKLRHMQRRGEPDLPPVPGAWRRD